MDEELIQDDCTPRGPPPVLGARRKKTKLASLAPPKFKTRPAARRFTPRDPDCNPDDEFMVPPTSSGGIASSPPRTTVAALAEQSDNAAAAAEEAAAVSLEAKESADLAAQVADMAESNAVAAAQVAEDAQARLDEELEASAIPPSGGTRLAMSPTSAPPPGRTLLAASPPSFSQVPTMGRPQRAYDFRGDPVLGQFAMDPVRREFPDDFELDPCAPVRRQAAAPSYGVPMNYVPGSEEGTLLEFDFGEPGPMPMPLGSPLGSPGTPVSRTPRTPVPFSPFRSPNAGTPPGRPPIYSPFRTPVGPRTPPGTPPGTPRGSPPRTPRMPPGGQIGTLIDLSWDAPDYCTPPRRMGMPPQVDVGELVPVEMMPSPPRMMIGSPLGSPFQGGDWADADGPDLLLGGFDMGHPLDTHPTLFETHGLSGAYPPEAFNAGLRRGPVHPLDEAILGEIPDKPLMAGEPLSRGYPTRSQRFAQADYAQMCQDDLLWERAGPPTPPDLPGYNIWEVGHRPQYRGDLHFDPLGFESFRPPPNMDYRRKAPKRRPPPKAPFMTQNPLASRLPSSPPRPPSPRPWETLPTELFGGRRPLPPLPYTPPGGTRISTRARQRTPSPQRSPTRSPPIPTISTSPPISSQKQAFSIPEFLEGQVQRTAAAAGTAAAMAESAANDAAAVPQDPRASAVANSAAAVANVLDGAASEVRDVVNNLHRTIVVNVGMHDYLGSTMPGLWDSVMAMGTPAPPAPQRARLALSPPPAPRPNYNISRTPSPVRPSSRPPSPGSPRVGGALARTPSPCRPPPAVVRSPSPRAPPPSGRRAAGPPKPSELETWLSQAYGGSVDPFKSRLGPATPPSSASSYVSAATPTSGRSAATPTSGSGSYYSAATPTSGGSAATPPPGRSMLAMSPPQGRGLAVSPPQGRGLRMSPPQRTRSPLRVSPAQAQAAAVAEAQESAAADFNDLTGLDLSCVGQSSFMTSTPYWPPGLAPAGAVHFSSMRGPLTPGSLMPRHAPVRSAADRARRVADDYWEQQYRERQKRERTWQPQGSPQWPPPTVMPGAGDLIQRDWDPSSYRSVFDEGC